MVSDGAHDTLLLEWSEGPSEGVTGWQYRTRVWRNARPLEWGAWADVEGSAADTRRYLLEGLDQRTGYSVEVRPVLATVEGTASNTVFASTHHPFNIPEMYPAHVVEGDGSTEWRIHRLSWVITIPAGMRMTAARGAAGANAVAVFDIASNSRLTVAFAGARSGQAVERIIRQDDSGQPARDVNALLDRIAASLRRVPVSTPIPYDRLDLTGAAATPGSYAFLMSVGDTSSAIQNFGMVAAGSVELRVHPTDAHGQSHDLLYDQVEVGDSFDYRTAPECVHRFRVTAVAPSRTPRTYGIEHIRSYGGRCGPVDDPAAAVRVELFWDPLPGYEGPDGVRIFLSDEPAGAGRYRLSDGSSCVIEVPPGTQVIQDGLYILEPDTERPDVRAIVPLIDVETRSQLDVEPRTCEEVGRTVHPSASRDVGAIFDQMMASIRVEPVE